MTVFRSLRARARFEKDVAAQVAAIRAKAFRPDAHIGDVVGDPGPVVPNRWPPEDEPGRWDWMLEIARLIMFAAAMLIGVLIVAGIGFAIFTAVAVLGNSLPSAYAKDDGRFKDATPEIRQWFKSQRSPAGLPCCDISDGHRTTWKADAFGV